MARQGGVYVNGESVGEERVLTTADLRDGGILLRAGKKKYARLTPR
jgi:tyrosyl-tRNA synthetase